MNNLPPKRTARKRLLLFSLLAAVILTFAWISYFLITFDLDNYRQQAEEKLSTLLSLPVKIGSIDYQLHDTNLALHITNLQIGEPLAKLQIEVPDILINLRWRGLLERNFKFAKISLNQPQLWIRATGIEQHAGQPAPLVPIDPAQLDKISIDGLEIYDGTVHLDTALSDQPSRSFSLTQLNIVLSDIGLDRATQIIMKGELNIPGQEQTSHLRLQGETTLRHLENEWLSPHVNLALQGESLNFTAVRALFAEHLADWGFDGTGELTLHLTGSADKSLDIQVGLTSSDMALRPGATFEKPVHFQNLQASGQLQLLGDHPGLSDLSLQLDKSQLAGRIGWSPQGEPFAVSITLLNSKLTVPQIKQWLPDFQEAQLQTFRQNFLDQGSVQIERAEFTLGEDAELRKKWRIEQITGEFRHIVWQSGTAPAAEITSLPFLVVDKQLQIDKGLIQLGSVQLNVSGKLDYSGETAVLHSCDFSGELRPNTLFDEWQMPTHSLASSGQIVFNGHLEGPLKQLKLDLQGDLSQLSLSHPEGLKITPEPGDKLTLHGSLSPREINIEHGSIKWSAAKGHLSGSFFMEEPDKLAIDALLTINDLSRLAETLPLLEELQLSGQADLSVSQRGLPENNRAETILTLRDAGLHATTHIADLSNINGRVRLTADGLTADNLRVQLGQSPLTVQARLDDFTNPRLRLDVKAAAIHANDLIFTSKEAMLRDIDGQLDIDRDGLTFDSVDVRLDGGTKANVRGTIAFHPPFDVLLDITADFAHIGEVINLWGDRPEAGEIPIESESDEKDQAKIRINARAKRGDLYGMSFHDASGVIVPTHERLTIHPLDFSVGEGSCNTQVITEFSSDGPSLLRISGHAEGVDALEVYRELLNQKNIVRGKLRGDFYLMGEIGSNFLPSSYGNFSVQVHDGVLHQFPVLSKVFSLLNVSQIFALQLPDMDREGMPFDTLSANFSMENGIIKSEDLKIQSEAMNQSYTGQVNLVDKEVDFSMAIHPLGTVDKIISRIPVAGWLLTGKDKSLLTAHFSVKGKTSDVSVEAMPINTLSGPTIGLLRRTLGLPFKLVEDPQILWGGDGSKQ